MVTCHTVSREAHVRNRFLPFIGYSPVIRDFDDFGDDILGGNGEGNSLLDGMALFGGHDVEDGADEVEILLLVVWDSGGDSHGGCAGEGERA